LPCPADAAWSEVQKVSLLQEIARPLVTFASAGDGVLPARWPSAGTVELRMFLFGWVPLGLHELRVETVDSGRREIQTRERDRMVRRWDHRISIVERGTDACAYSDEVEIEAGPWTALVWLFAQAFFRHRHRRWASVASRLARPRPMRSAAATVDRDRHGG
jgi:hypothetical protein